MNHIEPYYASVLGRVRLPDYYMVLIGAIVFLQFKCLYLVDGNVLPVSDASLGIVAILFVSVYMRYPSKMTYRYQGVILFSIVLAAIASYTAVYNYHQPLIMGFRALRNWYGIMLLYFPVSKLLRVGRLHVDQLVKMIIGFAVVYALLGSLQFIVGDGTTILHISLGERYGATRVPMDMVLPVLTYFITLSRFLKSYGKKYLNISVALLMLFLVVVVSKTRMIIVTLAAVTLIAILMQRNALKKITGSAGFILLILLSLSSQIGSDILDMVMGKDSTQIDTASIRQAGREFYISHATDSIQHFIFGNGFPNITVYGVSQITGISRGFNMNDNGIIGLLYVYGFIFIIWVAVFHAYLIHDSIKSNQIGVTYFLINGLLGMLTLYPYCYSDFSTVICFPIVCAIIEFSYLRVCDAGLSKIISVTR